MGRLIALLIVLAGPVHAQGVSDADVLAAIERGLAAKESESAEGESGWVGARGMGFRVTVSGPLNRVATAAAARARRYQPFTIDSVTEGMRRQAVVVMVHPKDPTLFERRMQVTAPASHVVIQPRRPDDAPVIHPLEAEPFPVSWSNALGGQFESSGMMAVFPVEAVPAGEFDVVVITAGREYRARIRPERGPKIR